MLQRKNPLLADATTKFSSGQRVQIDTRVIEPWKHHDRPLSERDGEEIADLAIKIKSAGQLVPILVRPASEELKARGIEYELIYGCRRWEACKKLGRMVEADIKNISDPEAFVAMDYENADRKDINPMIRNKTWAIAFREAFDTYKDMAGHYEIDRKQISRGVLAGNFLLTPIFMSFFTEEEICQVKPGTINKIMAIFDTPEKIKELEENIAFIEEIKGVGNVKIRLDLLLYYNKDKGDEGASEAIIKLDGNPIRMKVSKAGGLTIDINKEAASQTRKQLFSHIGKLLDQLKKKT